MVGLHQGEVTKQVNGAGVFDHNLAIAATAIAAVAPNVASVDSRYDAIWFLRRSQRAVVGRVELASQNRCHARSDDDQADSRRARQPLGSGRSFTSELIEDRIEYSHQWFAKLDAATLPADARALANLILEQAGAGENDRQRLPEAGKASTTDTAWIKNQLFPVFRQILTEIAEGRTLWVVVENLDRVDVTQSGARRFLDTLYELAPSTQMIRVVLLGLDGGLPAGDPESAVYDDLRPPDNLDEDEIKTFIAYICADRKIPVAPMELDRMAKALWCR